MDPRAPVRVRRAPPPPRDDARPYCWEQPESSCTAPAVPPVAIGCDPATFKKQKHGERFCSNQNTLSYAHKKVPAALFYTLVQPNCPAKSLEMQYRIC